MPNYLLWEAWGWGFASGFVFFVFLYIILDTYYIKGPKKNA